MSLQVLSFERVDGSHQLSDQNFTTVIGVEAIDEAQGIQGGAARLSALVAGVEDLGLGFRVV